MKSRACKYEESIIGQIMSYDIYKKIYWNMLNLKIINNIRLTAQETKDYIDLINYQKGMTDKDYYEMKLKEV